MAEIVTLSSTEIGLLRHMIGYDSRHMPKHGKYLAWRNRSVVKHPVLDRLCDLGICKKVISEISAIEYYCLTVRGAELLSEYLGVTVVLQ